MGFRHQQIELVTALLAVFGLPQAPLAVARQPLRVAEAAGDHFGAAARQVDTNELAEVKVGFDDRAFLPAVGFLLPFIVGVVADDDKQAAGAVHQHTAAGLDAPSAAKEEDVELDARVGGKLRFPASGERDSTFP